MQHSHSILSLLALSALTACASPKVHDEVHHMDHRLSCAQMEHEIREMEKHHMSVEESKGFTFRNVVTTAVFFPLTMGTYSNVGDAQDASRARQKHLMGLYASKGCADAGSRNQPIVIMMPNGSTTKVEPVNHQYSETVPLDVDDAALMRDELNINRYSDAHIYSASFLFRD